MDDLFDFACRAVVWATAAFIALAAIASCVHPYLVS